MFTDFKDALLRATFSGRGLISLFAIPFALHLLLSRARDGLIVKLLESSLLYDRPELLDLFPVAWEVSFFAVDWIPAVLLGALICERILQDDPPRMLPRRNGGLLVFVLLMLAYDALYWVAAGRVYPALLETLFGSAEAIEFFLNQDGDLGVALLIRLSHLPMALAMILLLVRFFIIAPGYRRRPNDRQSFAAAWRKTERGWLDFLGLFILLEALFSLFDFAAYDLLQGWVLSNIHLPAESLRLGLYHWAAQALDSLYTLFTNLLWYCALAVIYQRAFQAESPGRESAR